MSSFLARLGPVNTRRAIDSIWKLGTRERMRWEKAGSGADQHRSYGDDGGVRWTAGGVTFLEESESGQKKQIQSEGEGKVKSQGYRPFWEHETTGDAFFSQRSPDDERWETLKEQPPVIHEENQEQKQNDLWERFERLEDEEEPRTQEENNEDDDGSDRFIRNTSMLEVDYTNEFLPALAKREADMLTRCLFSAQLVNDVHFLQSIPKETFSEIIKILAPDNFFAQLASAYVEFNTTVARTLCIAPMYQVAYEYSVVLRKIVALRLSAGIGLTLDDYNVLLRSARDLGSRRMGIDIWIKLLDQGLTPTTTSYNHFMSTVIWNGVHRAGGRQNVRVIPFNMMSRQKDWPPRRFRNYRIGRGGMREHVMRFFNEMIANGAIADEETFRILITACAREGDMETTKSILKKVWGIDAEGIIEGRDESEMMPKQIPETSRLRPSSSLLYTIAHAFGINNDVPGALRVVDFVARHYQLTITGEGWSQLFEWTFVLSIRRSGTSLRDGSTAGNLPQTSLMSLWETMTGPPYSIKPSMGMYNMLIKNLLRRSHTPEIIDKMQEGLQIYHQHRMEAKQAFKRLKEALTLQREGQHLQVSIESLRNEWEYRDLIRQRDMFWLRRWTRLLLGSFNDWSKVTYPHQIWNDGLPAFLWEWRWWTAKTVYYETATGFVEFEIWTDEERKAKDRVKEIRKEVQGRVLEDARKFVGHDWLHGREREEHVPRREWTRRPSKKQRDEEYERDSEEERFNVQL